MKLSRRNFLKRGALFVPAPFAILRANAQSMNAADGPFIAAGPTTFELLTLTGPGGPRNNFTGEIGGTFQMNPGKNVTAVALGTWVISGNTQTHTIKLYTGACALAGSVSINMTGLSTGIHYVALGSPVALSSNSVWYILTTYTAGGDSFPDGITASGALVTNVALSAAVCTSGTAGFVWPVNLLYKF